MSKIDKILAKLRKLMNLKESAQSCGNEGEANAAAAGINRLLTEYNLSLKDIPDEDKINNPVISEDVSVKKTIPGPWFGNLIACCCDYNFCRVLVVSNYDCKTRRYKKESYRIVGRKMNVEVVNYLVSFLENVFIREGEKSYPAYRIRQIRNFGRTPKTKPMYLRSYLQGCVYGLNEKFKEQQGSLSNVDVKALVCSSEAEIDDFLKDEVIGSGRASKASTDLQIALDGASVGRNVDIHKGIYADSIPEELRLT